MALYLALRSNKNGATPLVLTNGTDISTGYVVTVGSDWGFVDSSPVLVGSIDTDGSGSAGSSVGPRTITLPVMCHGVDASSPGQSKALERFETLAAVVDEIGRWKGRLRFRPRDVNYAVEFEVEHAKLAGTYWDKLAEVGAALTVQLVLTVRPYALGDNMDVADDFSVDTFGTAGIYNNGGADWTAQAGALTNLAITGGVADASANLATENVLIHTGTPYTYGDHQVTLKHTVGTTLSGYKAGVILKRVDASNYIEAYVDDTGAASRLRIDKIVAGVRTNMASNAITRLTVSTSFWIVGYIEGNYVACHHWTTQPAPIGGGSTTSSETLDSTEAVTFGTAISGRAGITFTPIQTAASIDEFKVEAYSYKQYGNFPGAINLRGSIPGNVPAKVDISYTPLSAETGTSMAFAWWKRPAIHNRVTNGGFEATGSWLGFVVTAVSGVISAATSITRITTTAYEGAACAQVVCPATTDTGASYRIRQRFKKGLFYTAEFYAKSSGGSVTALRCKLGASGNLATGSASALTTSWQRYTVTWQPTADADDAYVVAGINAATATTFQLDRVMVYEGTTAPASYGLGVGGGDSAPGGTPAIGLVKLESSAFATETSSASALAGYFQLATASPSAARVQAVIADSLAHITGDEALTVAALARVRISTGTTTPVLTLSCATAGSAPSIYTEFGSTGRSLSGSIPSSGDRFRWVYAGTISVPAGEPLLTSLRTSLAYGGTAPGVDALMLLPANAHCISVTGVAASGVPAFASAGSRTVLRSDLSATSVYYTEGPPGGAAMPGLLGSQVRFPVGDVDVAVMPTDYVIDRTDSNATADSVAYTGTFQFSVTPRYFMARKN